MPAMNTHQVRVIDPILTTVVQGYTNEKFVGECLFPIVPVNVRAGNIIEFNADSFKRYNTARAPGENTKRVEFGYQGKPYSIKQDALEGKVPFEHMQDANRVPGINLGTRSVSIVMQILALELECQQAAVALDASNYDDDHKVDLAGSNWLDDANDPLDSIDIGKAVILASIGMEPNVLIVSNAAFKAARKNKNVRDQFKYTSSKSITEDMLAEYLDVDKVVVGKAITFDKQGVSTSIWGKHAVLAYVPEGSMSMEEPSYGYTYELEGFPMVEEAYQDRSAKSWIYPVTAERAPMGAGMSAGYLIQNAG